MSEPWPKAALRAEDYRIVERMKWRALPIGRVLDIAEAWQAGLNAAKLAGDLGISTQTICMIIGKLCQAGVALRTADTMTRAEVFAAARAPAAYVPPSHAMIALAEFDDVVRRALQEREAYA